MRVPDAIEPAYGYRVWLVEGNRIYSLNHQSLWQPGAPLEAYCERDHEPPGEGCSCGIYAAATFNRLYDMGYTAQTGLFAARSDQIVFAGKVKLWGGIIPGTVGWRAQFAYPAKFLIPYSCARLARPLAHTYGVPYKLFNTQRKHKARR